MSDPIEDADIVAPTNQDEFNRVGWGTGRPPIYETPEEMQEAISGYFNGGMKFRKVLVGKPPNQKTEMIPVPTITGLCLYLGFADRHSFYDYEKKPEFSHTIKKARTFIESEYEEILAVTGNSGAIFALKNFGWVDKTELAVSGTFEETRSKMKGFLDEPDGDDEAGDSLPDDSPADPEDEAQ